MNKRTKISLVLVITLILLLGLTIPSLAMKKTFSTCIVRPIIEVNDEVLMTYTRFINGELEAYWTKVKGVDTLVNICTGTVPLGGEINSALSYAEFDAYCDYGDCEGGVFTIEEYGEGSVWDPDGGYYTADYRIFTLLEENGDFTIYSEYTP